LSLQISIEPSNLGALAPLACWGLVMVSRAAQRDGAIVLQAKARVVKTANRASLWA
jgi:hypothetical protein